MRLVLDTGIFISALISKGTPPQHLCLKWLKGDFQLVTSEPQRVELVRGIRYEKLRHYMDFTKANSIIQALQTHADVVENLPTVHYSRDPDDNPILATAIEGEADAVISGDKRDMLALKRVENIPIISPRIALDTLWS